MKLKDVIDKVFTQDGTMGNCLSDSLVLETMRETVENQLIDERLSDRLSRVIEKEMKNLLNKEMPTTEIEITTTKNKE